MEFAYLEYQGYIILRKFSIYFLTEIFQIVPHLLAAMETALLYAVFMPFNVFSQHMNVKNAGLLTGILEALIEHADWFFPEGNYQCK